MLCLGTIGWGIVSYANSTTVVATPLENREPVEPVLPTPTPTSVVPEVVPTVATPTSPEVVPPAPTPVEDTPDRRVTTPARRDSTDMQPERVVVHPDPEPETRPAPAAEMTESMTTMMSSGLMGLDEFEDDIQ